MPRISAERSRSQRLRLVEASVRVFSEQGYDATTVDAVCQACGLSKGAVYTYVASKEELFLAASEHVFEERYRTLVELWQDREPSTAVDRLLATFADSLARTDRSFLRLWVEGFLVASRMPALAALKATYHRRFGDLLADVLQAAQHAGELDPGLDTALAADSLMTLADGLMLHSLVPGLGGDPERSVRAMSEILAPLWGGRRS